MSNGNFHYVPSKFKQLPLTLLVGHDLCLVEISIEHVHIQTLVQGEIIKSLWWTSDVIYYSTKRLLPV